MARKYIEARCGWAAGATPPRAFELPKTIARGEGTLAFIIDDGGNVETASKTIPILLQTLDLHMYPEGGDLVAGVPNRVYIEARTPYGDPADIKAQLVINGKDQPVSSPVHPAKGGMAPPVIVKTVHEGRGVFSFVPTADADYRLQILEPTGIKTTFKLPRVKDKGVVLQSIQDEYAASQPVTLWVRSNNAHDASHLRLSLSQREREVAAAPVELEAVDPAGDVANQYNGFAARVTLTPPASADGVLRAPFGTVKGSRWLSG